MANKKLHPVKVRDLSGFMPRTKSIATIKKKHYKLIPGFAITGDAPKDFIKVYRFQKGKRLANLPRDAYIFKVGDKHYPNESITEFLLNKIGESLGFNMAVSHLDRIAGQIRFSSKYFLKQKQHQILNHGAELYAGFLEDKDFVEQVEQKKLSQEFFTIQFTRQVFEKFFPEHASELFLDFIKMLFLDAIIGNKDRHFYNWGVITFPNANSKVRFSPIYDTARGLFWNYHEDKILELFMAKDRTSKIKKYADEGSPKIGWEKIQKLNHFVLMEHISTLDEVKNCDFFKDILHENNLQKALLVIETEFIHLFSSERKQVIIDTLVYRFNRVKKCFNFAP